ncbi:hypothetical protein TNCV_2979561 [Trichonephila clavipes]|nr:hypothetical protein TNCV_2979561 [Trichonephila clavipes]
MPSESRGISPKKGMDLRRPSEHMKMWNEFVCQFKPVCDNDPTVLLTHSLRKTFFLPHHAYASWVDRNTLKKSVVCTLEKSANPYPMHISAFTEQNRTVCGPDDNRCDVGSLVELFPTVLVKFDEQVTGMPRQDMIIFRKRLCILPSYLAANRCLVCCEGGYVEGTTFLFAILRRSNITIYRKNASVNRVSFVGSPSHMLDVNYLNEKECRPVVIKTLEGVLSFKVSRQLIAHAPAYCPLEPMEWRTVSRSAVLAIQRLLEA